MNRNAKGIDILIYSQNAAHTHTIQVKTLSEASPVPLSNNLDRLFADFVIVCRHVIREAPECFILTSGEVRQLAHRGEKNGKVSFWLQPPDYTKGEDQGNNILRSRCSNHSASQLGQAQGSEKTGS